MLRLWCRNHDTAGDSSQMFWMTCIEAGLHNEKYTGGFVSTYA